MKMKSYLEGLTRNSAFTQFAPLSRREMVLSNRLHLDFTNTPHFSSRFTPRSLSPIVGLDFFGESLPAGEQSGDFFDLMPLDPPGLILFVGEVSNPGIGASILTTGLQAFLSNLACQSASEPESAVEKLNEAITGIAPEAFYASLFYACIDPLRRRLSYVNAGHEPPLIYHQHSQRTRRLEQTGTVLGLTARSRYRPKTIAIESGDTLVAFSDGITEPSCALRIVKDYPEANARELTERILEAAGRFRQGSPEGDDQTVVVARVVDTAFEQRMVRSDEVSLMAAGSAG